jgi:hypothetical protein
MGKSCKQSCLSIQLNEFAINFTMNKNKLKAQIIHTILYRVKNNIQGRILFFFLLISIISVAGEPCDQSKLVIENKMLQLEFVQKPLPRLKALIHKPSGQNLLGSTSTLFKLDVKPSEGDTYSIDGQNAVNGFIKTTRDSNVRIITIEYNGLGKNKDINALFEGTMSDSEPFVEWAVSLNNKGMQKIVSLHFPYVEAVQSIGSPENDFIVAPSFPGVMIINPSGNLPDNYTAAWEFPGLQSVQFLSFQDREAGIYIASKDTAGYGRDLRITKQEKNRFILSQQFKMSGDMENQWESPYNVVFGVTSGRWQQTADIYKEWAVNQFWCNKKLTMRDDIPDWWKSGPCVYTHYIRGRNSGYPGLPKHLQILRSQIGGAVVPRIGAWENHRIWTAGNYFPIYDEDTAKEIFTQIREDGFHPFVFLSGLYYTFRFEGTGAADIPGHEPYIGSFVIDKSGEPVIHTMTDRRTDGYKRLSYVFCPAAPGTKEFFRSVIDQLHELGIDIVQMDQATSGSGPACYSTEHGHKPGYGPYQSRSFRELLNDMREYGKSLRPDFLLLNEELHEELIPVLDAFHTREYCENNWFRDYPGARGIPLFTYLYHEYAMAYGGEGYAKAEEDPGFVRDMAVTLVSGKMPVVGTQIYMSEVHPDQVKMLRNHMNLLKTEAQEFLMLGRMLHPLELDVSTVIFEMGGKWHPIPVEEKVVLTSSWQSPEGNVGHCLVNITDTIQHVYLQLDTRNAPGWDKANIDLYRADKPEICERILTDTALPHDYLLELEPLEAVFFVIRPVKVVY